MLALGYEGTNVNKKPFSLLKLLGTVLFVIGFLGQLYEYSTSFGTFIYNLAWDLFTFNFIAILITLTIAFIPMIYGVMYLITGFTGLQFAIYPFLILDIAIGFTMSLILILQIAQGTEEDQQTKLIALLWFLSTDGLMSLGLYAIFKAPSVVTKKY